MIKKTFNLISNNLRYKLLSLVLLPVLLMMIALIFLAHYWLNEVSYRQLLMKVNADLNIAHGIFIEKQSKYLSELASLGESYKFRKVMELPVKEKQYLRKLIEELRVAEGYDFVKLINVYGCDFLNVDNCSIKKSALIQKALNGQPVTGVEVFSVEDLKSINSELEDKAHISLIQTLHEHPSNNKFEDRGMVLISYYPILNLDNDRKEVKAVLVGGVLLNKNYEFVDNLRDLIYSKGSQEKDWLGTVTIFLEDVRISTNVPGNSLLPTWRALGTRVSKEVREKVLTRGENWIDRAFVVNDWYISAYEPIIDVNDKRVGMLYIGFKESPFRDTFFTGLTLLVLLFIFVVGLSFLLAISGAKSIYRPIELMMNVVEKIQYSDEVRIGKLESEDELSMLAKQFDDMLDTLQEQKIQIQDAANELELKVEKRTNQLVNQKADLQHNLNLLKQTREKLVASEKLAAIGELTAGIAHEINNPTAVILGNMDLLITELGKEVEPVQKEVDLVIQQVYRIRAIINNLLLYSRPSDYQLSWSSVNINNVIEDTLVLIKYDLEQQNIKLNLDLRSTKDVCGNHQQYQQVLINLIVNAVHAQEANGRITIRTRDWRNKGVLMIVRDYGCGISKDVLPRIFDPFYTKTKSGTGLGLYVTSGILNQYGAEIQIRSRLGVGSCFFVWFYSQYDQTKTISNKHI